jgi:hypothetical protein
MEMDCIEFLDWFIYIYCVDKKIVSEVLLQKGGNLYFQDNFLNRINCMSSFTN